MQAGIHGNQRSRFSLKPHYTAPTGAIEIAQQMSEGDVVPKDQPTVIEAHEAGKVIYECENWQSSNNMNVGRRRGMGGCILIESEVKIWKLIHFYF